MNSVKNTMKKGFTLVELIVVMAIMSILLVAVMSMTGPATRIFKRTSMSDTAYSMANNAESYIKRTLEYVDNVWIFDSKSVDKNGDACITTDADPYLSIVKRFKKTYYQNVAVPTAEGATGNLKFVQGNVYVMHLDNSTGRIDVTKYHYNNSSNDTFDKSAAVNVLPEAYFKGDGAKYNIRYALGASVLQKVEDADGKTVRNSSDDPYYNVKSELDGTLVAPGYTEQALSIVVNRGAKPSSADAADPNQFEGPAVISVAPLPFTNIIERTLPNARPKRFVIKAEGDTEFAAQESSKAINDLDFSDEGYTESMYNFAGDKEAVSTKNDIYFVYSYADELIDRGS